MARLGTLALAGVVTGAELAAEAAPGAMTTTSHLTVNAKTPYPLSLTLSSSPALGFQYPVLSILYYNFFFLQYTTKTKPPCLC
jgi:hypothetical protein